MATIFDDDIFKQDDFEMFEEIMKTLYKSSTDEILKKFRIKEAYFNSNDPIRYNFYLKDLYQRVTNVFNDSDLAYVYEYDSNRSGSDNFYSDVLNSFPVNDAQSLKYQISHCFVCLNFDRNLISCLYLHIDDYRHPFSDNTEISNFCRHTLYEIHDIISLHKNNLKRKDVVYENLKKLSLSELLINKNFETLLTKYTQALNYLKRNNDKRYIDEYNSMKFFNEYSNNGDYDFIHKHYQKGVYNLIYI